MKILFTASECVPFVKTGGLADVVGALAPVLARQGHDVRVMIPLYAHIPQHYVEKMEHVVDFEVQLGWRRQYCGIEKLVDNGVTWYLSTASSISAAPIYTAWAATNTSASASSAGRSSTACR